MQFTAPQGVIDLEMDENPPNGRLISLQISIYYDIFMYSMLIELPCYVL